MVRRLLQRLPLVLALAAVACGGGTPTAPSSTGSPTVSAPVAPAPTPTPTPDPAPPPTPDPAPTPTPDPVDGRPPAPTPPVVNPPRLAVTRFLAFGDSITAGYVQGDVVLRLDLQASYPTKLQLMLASRYTGQSVSVVNAGKFGEWASDALSRFQSVLATHRPEAVLLLEGVNDLNTFGTAGISAARRGLDDMLNEARRQGVPVLIGTLPPVREPKGPPAADLVRLNTDIRNLVREPYAMLVDLYGAFGGDTSTLIGSDGLHPTELGYLRMAETYFAAIRQRFELPPAPVPTAQ